MKKINRIAFIAGVVAACLIAPITIRTEFVSTSLQSLVLFSIAAIAGERTGVLVALAYLLLGALGLPVFGGFRGGFEHLLGPTAGFLWAFPLGAWYVGFRCRRGNQDFFHFILYFFHGHVIWAGMGLLVLYYSMEGVDLWQTLIKRVLPGLLIVTLVGGMLSYFIKQKLLPEETGE